VKALQQGRLAGGHTASASGASCLACSMLRVGVRLWQQCNLTHAAYVVIIL
jgi:hypothetical protein